MNRPGIALFFLLAAGALGAAPAGAQEQLRLTRVNLHDPSDETAVTAIAQDRRGFIWFGNRYGLFRWDGVRLVAHRHNPDDATSISAGAITCLRIDPQGHLWIGTNLGLVDRLDPAGGAITHHHAGDEGQETAATGRAIADITIDRSGTIWIVREDGSLHQLARSARTFTRYVPNSALEIARFWSEGAVTQVFERVPGEFWVTMRSQPPRRFDPVSGRPGEVMPGYDRARYGDASLFPGAGGTILVAGWGWGLMRYDARRLGIEPISRLWPEAARRPATRVNQVLEDAGGDLWIATAGDGLLVHRSGGRLLHTRRDAADPASLSHDTVASLMQDAGGAVWLGTGAGLCTWHPSNGKFAGGFTRLGDDAGEAFVYALFRDDQHRLWVGSEAEKLSLFQLPESGAGAPVRLTPPQPLDTAVYAFLAAPGGEELVLGTADRGIIGYALATGAQRPITGPQHVSSLHLAGDDLLFGTYVNGLGFRIREGTEPVISYWKPARSGGRDIRSFDVTVIREDRSGTIWVGTDGEGLYRVYPGAKDFKSYLATTSGAPGLSDNRILSIWTDAAGILWIGTRNGLTRFDPASESFDRFYAKDGLPDNVVCGVLGDDQGRLWLGTMRGLACFDPATDRWQRYDTADGLAEYAFMPGACFKAPDGMLHFGSVHGFLSFDPARLRMNDHRPAIAITGLTVMNQRRPAPVTSERQPLAIPFEQNLFSFEFAALDYAAVGRNRYSWRLEGHDNTWIDGGGRAEAGYSQVQPGRYLFRVRGSNNDGLWSAEDAVVHLWIVPPLWMTWEFRIAAAVLILGTIVAGFVLRIRSIDRHRRSLEREIEERKIAELKLLAHQMRLKSLSKELTLAEERERRRIASALHDQIGHALFSTKVILNEQVENIGAESVADKLRSAIAAIDETLRHTRSLTAEISPPSLYRFGFVAAAEGLLDRLNEDHHIQGIFSVEDIRQPEEDIAILLYQSLREMLHNVVKHARASEVRLHLGGEGDRFVVTLTDNGVGFDAERVMTGDAAGSYGLFSIQQRLESIGGSLEVRSRPGAGAAFIMTVPLDSEKGDS